MIIIIIVICVAIIIIIKSLYLITSCKYKNIHQQVYNSYNEESEGEFRKSDVKNAKEIEEEENGKTDPFFIKIDDDEEENFMILLMKKLKFCLFVL